MLINVGTHRLVLSLVPLAGLTEVQEPGGSCGEAGAGRGLVDEIGKSTGRAI
jgi:hypothetical protein